MAAFFSPNSCAGGLYDDAILEILGDGNDSDIEDILEENFLLDTEVEEEMQDQPHEIQQHPNVPVPSTTSQPVSPPRITPSRRGQSRGRIWRQIEYTDKPHDFELLPMHPIRASMEYFTDYFNDEFYKLGAECTNNYHIHLLIGIFNYPRLYLFWRQNTRLALIADIMTCDRFTTLRSALHFVPEDQPSSAKERLNPLWKIQPVINQVRSGRIGPANGILSCIYKNQKMDVESHHSFCRPCCGQCMAFVP